MRCFVSGQVQGVGFRAHARQRAQALGLNGFARNLADGRVEVLVRGTPDALERMRDWLLQGPPGAAVTTRECELTDAPLEPGFRVL